MGGENWGGYEGALVFLQWARVFVFGTGWTEVSQRTAVLERDVTPIFSYSMDNLISGDKNERECLSSTKITQNWT